MLTDTRNSKFAELHSPEYDKVRWTGGFWKDAVDACAENMVPHLQNMFDSKDISHVVENFRIAAGRTEGDFDGTVFGDGDFYKWMESELYSAVYLGDAGRIEKLDEYIELIGEAQQADGYISTKQIIEGRQGKGLGRLGDINEFEVYNMGHLFTSACLHKRITGKDTFLEIAEKAAGYLQKSYEESLKSGDAQTAVCPSHYMGLIELYRTTGKKQYLTLARQAIESRDRVQNGMDDNQDRIPLKEHEKIIGHAVRATYLYAGVADLYAEEGDSEYLSMLDKVWRNMVDKKIYITGGIGALYNGCSPYGNFFTDQRVHQAFGYEYQLPNVTAYNETCASVGLVMWAYRMFNVRPRAEYFDIIERAMLNTDLAAVSLDGKKYFYENMLRRTKKLDYKLIWPLTRSEYILSYCCPPNLARTIMQSSEYAFSCSGDKVYAGLYGKCQAKLSLDDGVTITLNEETDYPYSGLIRFSISDVTKSRPILLCLRIPSWNRHARISLNGKVIDDFENTDGQYKEIQIEDPNGAEVVLELDMPVRLTIANPYVEEDTGQAVVEKGPMVYCVETPDCNIETLDDICLEPHNGFDEEKLDICGRNVLSLTTKAHKIGKNNFADNVLYKTLEQTGDNEIKVRFIPYFAWDNRGIGEMRTWLRYTL
jgi:DUF1680 family protein